MCRNLWTVHIARWLWYLHATVHFHSVCVMFVSLLTHTNSITVKEMNTRYTVNGSMRYIQHVKVNVAFQLISNICILCGQTWKARYNPQWFIYFSIFGHLLRIGLQDSVNLTNHQKDLEQLSWLLQLQTSFKYCSHDAIKG